jgi:hypothetical protein
VLRDRCSRVRVRVHVRVRWQRGWCKHIIACLATVVCDSVTAPEWVRRMPGANEVIALVSFDFIARCNNYARYG